MKHSVQLFFTLALSGFALASEAQAPATVAVDAAHLKPIATVDARFQSYNIEMVEVTGGRFWAPYKQAVAGPTAVADKTPGAMPAGMTASLFRYRTPINLANPQLRKLAAALGPAYVRVSGTWANTTYFQDTDATEPGKAPAGFGGVLTRSEWKGVLDFSRAVDAPLVTSVSIGAGVRDAAGVWTPSELNKVLAYTKSVGGSIAGIEFFNEPTLATMGGAPKGYDAAAYGRDFKLFREQVRKATPKTLLVGPDSVGDVPSATQQPSTFKSLRSEDLLSASGPGLDVFAYHYYGGVSRRCGGDKGAHGVTEANAIEHGLSAAWLKGTETDTVFYAKLRDRFEPGKPLWLTETAEVACGGNPWASSFLDSFRYLSQLGITARHGVQVVMHNTLAASDYGLLDESTLAPRPNYWAALLWRRLMGTTVLDAPSAGDNLYLYAQCAPAKKGGVTLLAINADVKNTRSISLSSAASRSTLTAPDLLGGTVELNGKTLQLTATGDLPTLEGVAANAGPLALPPASITFLTMATANNSVCR